MISKIRDDFDALTMLQHIKFQVNDLILGYDESLGHFTDEDFKVLHEVTREIYEIRRYISESSCK